MNLAQAFDSGSSENIRIAIENNRFTNFQYSDILQRVLESSTVSIIEIDRCFKEDAILFFIADLDRRFHHGKMISSSDLLHFQESAALILLEGLHNEDTKVRLKIYPYAFELQDIVLYPLKRYVFEDKIEDPECKEAEANIDLMKAYNDNQLKTFNEALQRRSFMLPQFRQVLRAILINSERRESERTVFLDSILDFIKTRCKGRILKYNLSDLYGDIDLILNNLLNPSAQIRNIIQPYEKDLANIYNERRNPKISIYVQDPLRYMDDKTRIIQDSMKTNDGIMKNFEQRALKAENEKRSCRKELAVESTRANDCNKELAAAIARVEEESFFDTQNMHILKHYLPRYRPWTLNLRETVQSITNEENAVKQHTINQRMRAIVIDWLIEVHDKLQFLPETLFLGVYIIDKYLRKVLVTRENLQMMGVAALLLAAKYIENVEKNFRIISDLLYLSSGNPFTKKQLIEMETSILNALDFRLTAIPTTYSILRNYLRVINTEQQIVNLSCYIATRMLTEESIIKFWPPTVACSAIYLARKKLGHQAWSHELIICTGYVESELHECQEEMCKHMACSSDLRSVKDKYSKDEFGSVATLNIDWTM